MNFDRFTLNLLPILVGALMVLAFIWLENALFPVVDGVQVTQLNTAYNSVAIAGYLHKRRNCAFIGIDAVGITPEQKEVALDVSYLSRQLNGTRPAGTYAFGALVISLPADITVDVIKIDALHDCHAWWYTKSHLVTIPLQGS